MKDKNQAFESETDLDAAGTGIFRFMGKAEKRVFFEEMPPFLRIVSGCENFFDRIFSGNVRFMFGYFKRIRSQSCRRGFSGLNFQKYDMSMVLLSLIVCYKHHRLSHGNGTGHKENRCVCVFQKIKHLSKEMPASRQLFKIAAQ